MVRSEATEQAVRQVPILHGGQWHTVETSNRGPVHNPSTGELIAEVPMCGAVEANRAVEAAAQALPLWAETPVVERARVMFTYREVVRQHFEDLARIVTREHGKTLAESRASVQRGLEMIEFACSVPALSMGRILPNIAPGIDSETVRQPVGICAGITPFNFPAMVPLWMFPVAIVCGNTFVLKPSEKVPLTAVRLGELLLDAGLPKGVFNMVHGGAEAVEALLTHPLVQAVSFVGSTRVAQHVYQTATAHGKRAQAAGGAKNHLVIMPDADLDQAAAAVGASAFGCAGERCMAGSVALPVGRIGDAFVDRLRRLATDMNVGETDGNEKLDMGPLITREHRDRVAGYLDIAAGEGATVALDGREIDYRGDGFLLGPSIVDQVHPGMRVLEDEIFGPLLSVVRADSLEDVLALGRKCAYGNGASIFTRDGHAGNQFKRHFNAGMIGINVGVPAPMAWFPFTGHNRSFFGDLHLQGTDSISFYTRQKLTLTRWEVG